MIARNIDDRLKDTVKAYTDKYFPEDNDPHKSSFFYSPGKDFIGLMGEVVVADYFGYDLDWYLKNRPVGKADAGYDVVVGGVRYDVKTLMSAIRPGAGYWYNVASGQMDTLADGFIFCTLLKMRNIAFVGGYIGVGDFRRAAIFRHKGEVAPSNGFVFPCDAYNIRLDDLHSLTELRHSACLYCDHQDKWQMPDGRWACSACVPKPTNKQMALL